MTKEEINKAAFDHMFKTPQECGPLLHYIDLGLETKWSRDVENAFKAGVEFALIDMLGKEEFENNKEVWFGDENDTLPEPMQTDDIDDVF